MKQFYFFIFYEAFTAQIKNSLNSLNSSLSLSRSLSPLRHFALRIHLHMHIGGRLLLRHIALQ